MSFLQLKDKTFLITGVFNRKSIAYNVAKVLVNEGAKLYFTVKNDEIKKDVEKLFVDATNDIFVLDVSLEKNILDFGNFILDRKIKFDGVLHSMAYANYANGIKPFHETSLADYLEATTISAFSLSLFMKALAPSLNLNASVVTISISNTKVANYGFLGPIKASLESMCASLAKALSHSGIRFNVVAAGPLKTSASAGIPGYIDNYLYAEALTLRKNNLSTQEVANSIVFLLSPASSGINATSLVIDAGMNANYFDEEVVSAYSRRR